MLRRYMDDDDDDDDDDGGGRDVDALQCGCSSSYVFIICIK